MSRIGRNPITVPAGVTIEAVDGIVTVKGPNATMSRTLPEGIFLTQEGDTLTVGRVSDETKHKSLHGLTRTLVANMVVGVTTGWTKELEIIGAVTDADDLEPRRSGLGTRFLAPREVQRP